jgi:hypothetical protein
MNRSNPLNLLGKPFKNGLPRGALFGGILMSALLAFEVFNYSTTDFALTDLLGSNLKFAGLRWATILSFAFCGIDFAGIARLFTPEQGRDEPAEVWYLFGAWLLAAAMNACLTWWGISVAVTSHTIQGSSIVSSATLTKAVPVFVAVMVWLIRVLIIGTFSMAGERLFSMDARPARRSYSPASSYSAPRSSVVKPRPKPRPASAMSASQRGEPTYHPLGASARGNESQSSKRF